MNAFLATRIAGTGFHSDSDISAHGCLIIIQKDSTINRHASEEEDKIRIKTEKQNISEPLMTIDKSNINPDEQIRKAGCRTSPLIDGFYLCNINKSDCEHSLSYGLDYLCRSPNRHEYSKW